MPEEEQIEIKEATEEDMTDKDREVDEIIDPTFGEEEKEDKETE